MLYDLCAALVREGLAGPEIWNRCGESSVAFAQRTITEAIGEERWKLLCELAAKEQDPQKLLELTREINSHLLFKQKRLTGESNKEPVE